MTNNFLYLFSIKN